MFTRILQPVMRQGAERYLRLTLVAFAASVILTRLYLSLTGYPQLGSGTFHIAHLLWGGLLLFIAALLPLILSNRWVYSAGGVVSGIGVGLFIDEVGKFITRNNDYFYPAAAPIIYAFFLLTVLMYMQVGRRRPADDRAELYRAFDDMAEVLDHDLDSHERADLEARLLKIIQNGTHPDYVRLAQVLSDFLNSDAIKLAKPHPGPLARAIFGLRRQRDHWLTRDRLKVIVVTGLILGGVLYVLSLAASLAALSTGRAANDPGVAVARREAQAEANAGLADQAGTAPAATPAPGRNGRSPAAGRAPETDLPASQPVQPAARSFRTQVALWLRDGLGALVGVLMLTGAVLLLRHRERRGAQLGIYGLLLALTTVDLLIFYFNQFGAVTEALVQFVLLEGLVFYRRHFTKAQPS